jgi:PII-like signaling protein
MDDGVLLRIYMAESALINNEPGYKYLVRFFLGKGFPGCTVVRGMSGFGHEHLLKTVDVFQLSLDLPVVIDVVDTRERIMAILPEVEPMIVHGLVMLQDVRMIRKVPERQ